MKHQRQPYNGCFPTTVAMLYDVDVDEVIKVGLEGTSWTEWNKGFDNQKDCNAYRQIVTRILTKFPGPRTLAYNISIPNPFPPFPDELPNGQGAITIHSYIGNHIVAYDNQVIFDGNHTIPIPWSMWRDNRQNQSWNLVRILTMYEITNHNETLNLQLSLNLKVC